MKQPKGSALRASRIQDRITTFFRPGKRRRGNRISFFRERLARKRDGIRTRVSTSFPESFLMTTSLTFPSFIVAETRRPGGSRRSRNATSFHVAGIRGKTLSVPPASFKSSVVIAIEYNACGDEYQYPMAYPSIRIFSGKAPRAELHRVPLKT